MKIEIINGPNLNLLGVREPEIYGKSTLKEIERKVVEALSDIEVELQFWQTNSEGEIINLLHSAKFRKGSYWNNIKCRSIFSLFYSNC